MWGIIIAMISGALMSIQGVFNEEITKASGIWITAAFVQISAFVVCIIAWFIDGKNGTLVELFSVSKKYMLLGGVLGALITYTVIKGVELLGPAQNAQLIVISQIIVAYVIEVMGLFGVEKIDFEWKRLIGVAIMTVGIVIFKWGQ